MSIRGAGKAIQWIRQHANDADGDCLIWPFYRNPNGYGHLAYLGDKFWAHRYMCSLVNGEPPEGHEAAHSCGRGHDGCVHPKHLSWKTKGGNLLDCRVHGTHVRHHHGNKGRVTRDQAIAIRALKGQMRQQDIAAMFGVSPPTVRDIFTGRSHSADV
jgi:hypothetical protein